MVLTHSNGRTKQKRDLIESNGRRIKSGEIEKTSATIISNENKMMNKSFTMRRSLNVIFLIYVEWVKWVKWAKQKITREQEQIKYNSNDGK